MNKKFDVISRIIMNKIRKKVSMRCPEKGTFIGYKAVLVNVDQKMGLIYGIAKLRIPETAQRSSAFGYKCRCSEAFVEEITSIDGLTKYHNGLSLRGIGTNIHIDDSKSIRYVVGETVKPDSFDPNWWDECSNGIHFFMTREEAENYIP